MNKIAIIGVNDLFLMQYLFKYTEILDNRNIKYDVIYWNRGNVDSSDFYGNRICFKYAMNNYAPRISKLKGFFKYIRFVRKTIRANRYDKIILLTTQAALPLYLFNRNIRKKILYVYDFRDLTYERNSICKKLIKNIIKKSYFTAISSLGFKEVIGNSNKMIMSHNVRDLEYIHLEKIECKDKIRIVYWGMVRQVEFNKKVIDFFGGDNRFEVVYHGEGYVSDLEEFCKDKGYKNIKFTGKYNPDQIISFVGETDILLNLYDNDFVQRLATTVKLYDGIRFGLPMIIAKGSYMDNLMQDNKYIFALDIEKQTSNDVYHWFNNLDCIDNPYQKEIEVVNKDDSLFEKKLLEFCRE